MKYIYLDSNFWIDLGDGILNGFSKKSIEHFYYLLKELVYTGKAVCPISNAIFIELFKQKNIEQRIAIANIMDEFSNGLTTDSKYYIAKDEIHNYSKNTPHFPWKDISQLRTISQIKICDTRVWKEKIFSNKTYPSLSELAQYEIVGDLEKYKKLSNNISEYLQMKKEKHADEANQFKL